MTYTPKNLDIPAYSKYLHDCISSEQEKSALAIAKAEARKEGFLEGIQAALQGLQCSNFERDIDPDSYRRGIDDLLYELGKELCTGCGDLRERNISLDEKASLMADLIRNAFGVDNE